MIKINNTGFRFFIWAYAIFFLIGILLLSFMEKGDFVICLNQHATTQLDLVFQGITTLGLGGLFAVPIVLFLGIRYAYAIAGTITLIFTGIFTFLGKMVLFNGMPRPTAYFQNNELQHFIANFEYHHHNSFPSGHTMTAFALFSLLAVLINRKMWSAIFLLIAILVGISRMYLLQHFWMDVVAGSALGVLCTLIGIMLSNFISKAAPKVYHKNLLMLFRKK